MSRFDQAKAALQANKIQKEVKKHVSVAEAGDGAVKAEVSGEGKLKKITIDPEFVDVNDIEQLERWVEDAVREATQASQEFAAEKMKPILGMLGNLGL